MIAWIRQNGPGSFSNGTKTTWWAITFQKLHFLSSYILPVNVSSNCTTRMLNFSDRHTPVSSPDEYPVLTSSELSQLLLDQEMNFAVAAAFSSSPLSTTLLRQYLFLSHNLEQICQDLLHHQQERESIFDVLSHSAPFQDIITPLFWTFDTVNDKFPLLTLLLPLFMLFPTLLSLNKNLNNGPSLFKKEVTAITPFSLIIRLLMKN